MARKKKQDKTRPGKEFQNSPFKNLKGLVVSDPQTSSSVSNTTKEAPMADREEMDDESLFAREMNMLKVEKRHGDGMSRALPPESPLPEPTVGKDPAPASDQELFLAALGDMDTVFRDEVPAEEVPAAPRRMKQLRQGKIVPEAELDLHGAIREDARQKVRFFLEDSVYQGLKTVLVITGRGKGSASGPVLRDDMEKYLNHEAKAWVVEWGRAPARYGGDGALVVFLRSGRKA